MKFYVILDRRISKEEICEAVVAGALPTYDSLDAALRDKFQTEKIYGVEISVSESILTNPSSSR